jgi:23S rRNA maturation mini-RNase III
MEKRDYLLLKISEDYPTEEFPFTDTIERLLDLLYLQQENFDDIWFKIHQILENNPNKILSLIYTIIVSEEIDNRDMIYQSIQDIPPDLYYKKIQQIKDRIRNTKISTIPKNTDDAEMMRVIVNNENLRPIWQE